MEINLQHYKNLETPIDFVLYLILKTIKDDCHFATQVLLHKENLVKMLEEQDWICMINFKMNPTAKLLKLFEAEKSEIQQVLDHFNTLKEEYLEVKRKSTLTASTKKLISGRLATYSIEDVCGVLTMKFMQWANDSKMRKYLRFETLLNATHFEGYIIEYDTFKLNNNLNHFTFG